MSRIALIFLPALVALLTVGCDGPAVEQTPVVRPVKIHQIGSLAPSAIREYPGTIRAYQTAEMGFEVSGRVTDFLVREAEHVEKGQALARLDARDYEAELKVAEANLAKAQADEERSKNIAAQDPGAISKDQLEINKRAVAVTEAKLLVSQKAVEDAELQAPFAGVIARKLVEDFANVQAKQPVLILQDNSILEIEIAVPERDFVGRVNTDETIEEASERFGANVIVSALPDREFSARLKEFATTADPVTRTFSVKLNFDNPEDVNILPGMTARVRVVIDPDSAWSVPATAAQADEQGNTFVWKIDPDSMIVSATTVELGEMSGDRVLLSSGVGENELVAISGVASLREGMQVREYSK